jgi:hypothetical protein
LLKQLADELLDKEVLNYDDIVTLIGACPFGDKRKRIDVKPIVDTVDSSQQLPL